MSVSNVIASSPFGGDRSTSCLSAGIVADFIQPVTKIYSVSDIIPPAPPATFGTINLSLSQGGFIQFNNLTAGTQINLPSLTTVSPIGLCLYLVNRSAVPLQLVSNVASLDFIAYRGSISGGGASSYFMRPWETCMLYSLSANAWGVLSSGEGQTTAEDSNSSVGQQRSGYFSTNASGASGTIAVANIEASSDVVVAYVCPLNATVTPPATTVAVTLTGVAPSTRPSTLTITPGATFGSGGTFAFSGGLHPNSIYSYIVVG